MSVGQTSSSLVLVPVVSFQNWIDCRNKTKVTQNWSCTVKGTGLTLCCHYVFKKECMESQKYVSLYMSPTDGCARQSAIYASSQFHGHIQGVNLVRDFSQWSMEDWFVREQSHLFRSVLSVNLMWTDGLNTFFATKETMQELGALPGYMVQMYTDAYQPGAYKYYVQSSFAVLIRSCTQAQKAFVN